MNLIISKPRETTVILSEKTMGIVSIRLFQFIKKLHKTTTHELFNSLQRKDLDEPDAGRQ